jgi:hypothetical protein
VNGLRRVLRSIDYKHPVTSRSKSLICVGFVALLHAYAYFIAKHSPTPLPTGLALISEVIPVRFWATLWLIAGVGAIWAALYKPIIHHTPVKNLFQSVMVAMFNLWGFAYLAGWLITFQGRNWVIGGLYLGVAGHMYFTRRLVEGVPPHEHAPIPRYSEEK